MNKEKGSNERRGVRIGWVQRGLMFPSQRINLYQPESLQKLSVKAFSIKDRVKFLRNSLHHTYKQWKNLYELNLRCMIEYYFIRNGAISKHMEIPFHFQNENFRRQWLASTTFNIRSIRWFPHLLRYEPYYEKLGDQYSRRYYRYKPELKETDAYIVRKLYNDDRDFQYIGTITKRRSYPGYIRNLQSRILMNLIRKKRYPNTKTRRVKKDLTQTQKKKLEIQKQQNRRNFRQHNQHHHHHEKRPKNKFKRYHR